MSEERKPRRYSAKPVLKERVAKLERALATIAQFRGQLNPKHFGVDNNFATAVIIAEEALKP